MTSQPESEHATGHPLSETPLLSSSLSKLSEEEAHLLRQHFEAFAETTNKLVAAQQQLQSHVRTLMEELDRKNRQLEAVNLTLQNKIEETEAVKGYLDRVIDSMQTGLIAADNYGRITRINRAAQRILRWTELSESMFTSLFQDEHATPLGVLADPEGGSRSGEIRLLCQDGDSVLVRYTAVPISAESAVSLNTEGILFVFEDRSELRLLEEKVRRSNRLTALGELAAGVAHEMRNPLATIRGYLQLLPTEYEDPEFRADCGTRLVREIDRLARLTDDLLDLSRPIHESDKPVDLLELWNEVLHEQRDLLEQDGISLINEVIPVPPTHIDRDRIKQVLLNLVINARQAMSSGGRLCVATKVCEEEWGPSGGLVPMVALRLEDSGHGIESRYLDRVFDPFFTTKDQGTGLGLALCHRIMEEHGGTIHIDSTPGRGTVVTLYFPVWDPHSVTFAKELPQ